MQNNLINLVKIKKGKWKVEGMKSGWISNRTFPTKWKAKVAIEVFKKGGRVSDYWKKSREESLKKEEMVPSNVLNQIEAALIEIEKLDPTPEEIEEYAKQADYGVVTSSESKNYFPPKIHDTWLIKRGGRVHIDIGSGGYHLMLDKIYVWDFIKFIKNRRASYDA